MIGVPTVSSRVALYFAARSMLGVLTTMMFLVVLMRTKSSSASSIFKFVAPKIPSRSCAWLILLTLSPYFSLRMILTFSLGKFGCRETRGGLYVSSRVHERLRDDLAPAQRCPSVARSVRFSFSRAFAPRRG